MRVHSPRTLYRGELVLCCPFDDEIWNPAAASRELRVVSEQKGVLLTNVRVRLFDREGVALNVFGCRGQCTGGHLALNIIL